ncbi:MAG: hypothetical protein JOS17DRAFT_832576 [Linnemannia elongata]|nr:MAG: hypothetical protein JOS17DRAFT_832576 [Linnemannia elongata]
MQLFTPASIPLLVLLSLLSISNTTAAAPKTSSPSPAGATPDDKCRPCLARELRTVPKCGLLSPSTPALPSSEHNWDIIKSGDAPKPIEVAATTPDPKLAAAAASTSNTMPDTKDSKAGGDAKPAL